MKKISILGSTGSIGKNTIHIARHLKEACRITALAAHSNIDLLEQQAKEFNPSLIAVYKKDKALELQKRLPHIEVVAGMEGVVSAAQHQQANMVVSAMTGTLGLVPTVAAIQSGKHVALANKEALVSGGALVMQLVKKHNVQLLPIDSEHSAIFQCLNGENQNTINRIVLTASGGPFRSHTMEQLQCVTVENALNHPTWKMGPKVTIDSSTLMNKGLEVIEAHWLYGVPVDQIEVVVHPQSIIHSMVEFCDGSMMAQMGEASMQLPIQYALTHPERLPGIMQPFDFTKHHTLQFFAPDTDRFRCLDLAFQAIKAGGSFPCYMNAANEVLVERFLSGEYPWLDIGRKLDTMLLRHQSKPVHTIEEILAMDHLAREEARQV